MQAIVPIDDPCITEPVYTGSIVFEAGTFGDF